VERIITTFVSALRTRGIRVSPGESLDAVHALALGGVNGRESVRAFLRLTLIKNANDIPVDAHQLIALCAPRPTFISYGIPEKGDALWLDQQGSYMAAVAAGPAFRLLGVRDLGDPADYRVAQKPPVNHGLLDGHLAWRQHDGGHEERTNMKHFLRWANPLLRHTPPAPPPPR